MKIDRIFPKKLCINNLNVQNLIYPKYISSNTFIKPNNTRVIVIGAGIAGLIAAKHLYENNFTNIKILEASDHYGGRIQTKTFGDTSVELGVNNIPKTLNSALTFQKYLNINSLKKFDLHEIFIKCDGTRISPNIQRNIKQTFDNILKDVDKTMNSVKKFSINGKEFLETETETKSKILFGQESQTASKIFQALINDLRSFYGCDMSYVHIDNLKKMLNIYSNLVLEDCNMIDLLQPLVDGIYDKIHYNEPVSKINYKTAEITCIDGKIYKADHIICTLPLGHIKTYASYLFDPGLPKKKVKAMYEVGYGTPEMVYVRFDDSLKSWFPVRYIYPILNYDQNSNQTKFYKNITAIYRLPTSQHVLKVNCCKGAECHDNDNDVLDGVNKFLSTFCKKPPKIQANEILRSNWATDPKFFGGMPYLISPKSKRYVDTIACPIYWKLNELPEKPILMFAGDSTELNGFGTIEAAVKSGLREAKRLIDYYNYAFVD